MKFYLRYILFPLITLMIMASIFPDASLEFLSLFALWGDSELAGIFAAVIASGIGVYLVFNRMVFTGLAMTQVSGVGIFLSFFIASLVGVDLLHTSYPLIGAFFLSFVAMFAFSKMSHLNSSLKESIMAILFSISSALIVVIGNLISEGKHEIDHLLFGSIVSVSTASFWIITFGAICFIMIQFFWGKHFLSMSFDEKFYMTIHPKFKKVKLGFYILLGLGITLSLHVIGSIPTFAFIVLPSSIAFKQARNSKQVFVIATIFSVISLIMGYYISYVLDLPTGGVVILYLTLWVLMELFFSRMMIRKSPPLSGNF